MTAEPGERCAGAVPARDETVLPARDLPLEPGAGELAARLRMLRRARREAETRAARVRRVLLAPTVPAPGRAHVRPLKPHRR
ncbi:MAG TPA: hypothetical protein VIL71_15045 [Spirillospora sp.]